MKKLMQGKQIYLRKMQPEDANERYLSWINDPQVNQYTETRFDLSTLQNIKDYVDQQINSKDSVFLAMVLTDTGQHIGNIKIHRIDKTHKNAEISLLIGEKTSWGKGIGAEAISLITQYAFNDLKLNKLYAKCYSNNIGSIKAFEKAGYIREGCMRKQYCFGDVFVDGIILGMLRNETGGKNGSS